MSDADVLEVVSHSVNTTRRLGYRLGRRLRGGDVVVLSGDLGAGKTTFTQGTAVGLGIDDSITSPTFTLINEYQGVTADGAPILFYHVDLYRLGSASADSLGLDDYLADPASVGVIEWPQMAPEALPTTALAVELTALTDTKRRLTFRPYGPEAGRYDDRLAALRQELYGAAAR